MKSVLKYLGAAANIICYAIVFFGIFVILEYYGFSHYEERIDAEIAAGEGTVDPKIAKNVNLENFNKIKINAAYAEVCDILGGEGTIAMEESEIGEPPFRSGEYVWAGEGKATKIFVLFDRDNKVALKRFFPVPNIDTIPGKPLKFGDLKNLKGVSYAKFCKTADSPGHILNEGRGDLYRLKDRKTHLSKNQTVELYTFKSLVEENISYGAHEKDTEDRADKENSGYEIRTFIALFVDGKYRDDVIALPSNEDFVATSNLL